MPSFIEWTERLRRHTKNLADFHTEASLTLTDITTNDVSTSKHGFVTKAPNDTTKFYRGDASWATPTVGAIASSHFTDDFIAALVLAGTSAQGLWTMSNTGGTATALAAVANHPGILQFDTTAANPGFIGLHATAGAIGSVLPADFFDLTFIVRPAAAIDGNFSIRLGLNDTSTSTVSGTQPTNGIFIEKLPADTGWIENCRNAGTSTRVGALGNPVNGTWAKLRIRRVDASTIGFSLDGGTENLVTTNIPTVALKPFIEIGNNATANSKKLDIDLIDLVITSITR